MLYLHYGDRATETRATETARPRINEAGPFTNGMVFYGFVSSVPPC